MTGAYETEAPGAASGRLYGQEDPGVRVWALVLADGGLWHRVRVSWTTRPTMQPWPEVLYEERVLGRNRALAVAQLRVAQYRIELDPDYAPRLLRRLAAEAGITVDAHTEES